GGRVARRADAVARAVVPLTLEAPDVLALRELEHLGLGQGGPAGDLEVLPLVEGDVGDRGLRVAGGAQTDQTGALYIRLTWCELARAVAVSQVVLLTDPPQLRLRSLEEDQGEPGRRYRRAERRNPPCPACHEPPSTAPPTDRFMEAGHHPVRQPGARELTPARSRLRIVEYRVGTAAVEG